MNCKACDATIPGDARICPACGADVTAAAASADPVNEFFEKAKTVGRQAMETDIAKDTQKLAGTAVAKGREALDSDFGREVKKLAEEATTAGKSALNTRIGQEVAVGAVIGAVIAIPVPFVGPLLGAAAGAGIAWFRAKSKGK